jgi:hypothetical protein
MAFARSALPATAILLVQLTPALACTCVEDFEESPPLSAEQRKKMTPDERIAAEKRRKADIGTRKIAKADIVVRGKVVSFQGGENVVFSSPAIVSGAGSATLASARVVSAEFRVLKSIKGKTAENITLLTGFGTGDCGIASAFLVAVAWDREVSFSLQRIDGASNSYFVNMCGYGEMHERTPN